MGRRSHKHPRMRPRGMPTPFAQLVATCPTRVTTQPGGGKSVLASLRKNLFVARVRLGVVDMRLVLGEFNASELRTLRTTLHLIGAMLKSSGTVNYKASAPSATAVPSKRKKTPGRKRALTGGPSNDLRADWYRGRGCCKPQCVTGCIGIL